MLDDHMKIGEIRHQIGSRLRVSDIIAAPGYGVIVPRLMTSNGSAPFVADYIACMIRDIPLEELNLREPVSVVITIGDVDMTAASQAEITAALLRLYYDHVQTVKEKKSCTTTL